jgi:hypothetical protein
MSELTTMLVRGYHANIERLLQQMGGTLTPYVRVESQNAEKDFYEQIGGVVAEQVATRFAASPQVNTPYDRRMVTITPYHVGDFVDSFEKVQTLADPKSLIVENFVMALNRERDRVCFQALYGTSYSGKEGTTTVAWPTTASTSGGNRVDESFGTANSGLTIAKLIEAKRQWLAFFNDPGKEVPVLVYNSAGMADLLNTTQVTSSDYNTVKALVQGEVDQFIFKFVAWEGYVLDGTNIMRGTSPGAGSETVDRYFVFPKSAILNAVGMDVQTRVVERQDRSFHWYAYARAMFGATRMQENKIMEIEAKR